MSKYEVGDYKWEVINQWDTEDYSEYVTKFETYGKEDIKFVQMECIKVDGSSSKWKKVKELVEAGE